jgi:hypothetical protein
MTLANIHWAHIDAEGNIICWGTAQGTDVFLQPIEPGLTAVARPADVTGFSGWKYLNGAWTEGS